MGSIITLCLGRLEVDRGKNAFFRNHSPLFEKADLTDAEYFYADDEVVVLPAYVRTLSRVIPRLELLGFSLDGCRKAYAEALQNVPHYYPKVNIDFDAFHQALCAVDLDRVRNDEYDGDFDLGEFAKYVLSDPEFKRVSAALSGGSDARRRHLFRKPRSLPDPSIVGRKSRQSGARPRVGNSRRHRGRMGRE